MRIVLNGKSEEKAVAGIRFSIWSLHIWPESQKVPEETWCLFTMQLLGIELKGKDWKHSARIIKGSPKIIGKCCTYWKQHLPEKADRKHSPKFD